MKTLGGMTLDEIRAKLKVREEQITQATDPKRRRYLEFRAQNLRADIEWIERTSRSQK